MILTLVFLVISCLSGCLFVGSVLRRKAVTLAEVIIFGSILGIGTISLLIFIVSYIVSFRSAIPAVLFSTLAAILVFYLKNRLKRPISLKFLDPYFFITTTLGGIIFFVLLNKTTLYPSGNYFNASPSTYGDLPFHLTLITNFAYGKNFPPLNPIAPFEALSYHFLADFISSIVLLVSDNLRLSLILPQVILGMLMVGSIYLLAKRIFSSNLAAFTSPFIFLFSGGIGFLKFFEKLINAKSFLDLQFRYAHIPDWGVEYPNMVSEILMAERALLVGIPVAVTALFFLYLWVNGKNKICLFLTGFSVGILAYANIYGFITIGFVVFFIFLTDLGKIRNKKIYTGWLICLATALLISLPMILVVSSHIEDTSSFVRLSLGEWPPIQSGWGKNLFWLTNFGLVPILALIVIFKKKFLHNDSLKILAPLSLFAIIVHVVIFQPYAWDNNRIVIFPYLAMSILAAGVIAKLFSGGSIKKFLALLILGVSVLSGVLVAFFDPSYSLNLFNKRDFVLAEAVREITDPSGTFLTARNHNHPIVSLAGRKTLLGYGGYLWTHGINDPPEIVSGIENLYSGKIDKEWIKKYRVRYIVVGTWERDQYKDLNLKPLENSFKLIYNQEGVKIFDVKNDENQI